ncbi:MAG: YgiQ family radical SAM protein [Clostridia bacterium]|nr:YgiQ family radical SAM protein [Clostridia bacterium]
MTRFLPVDAQDMRARGWDAPDFVFVSGDAYVDHPSFAAGLLSRVLEAAGYRVAILAQPAWRDCEDFKRFGKPKLGFLVSAGAVDSMVNHFTAAKKRRHDDYYSPGCEGGRRPDRATVVYCNRIREAWGDIFIAIGGIEASLRRFAHYDYWDDRVRNSILVDSGADFLMYGMGERTIVQMADALRQGLDPREMAMPGTCTMNKEPGEGYIVIPSAEEVAKDKKAYADSFRVQYDEQDPIRGKGIAQKHGKRYLNQHKPAMPLSREELDSVYALPFLRQWHPMYAPMGGVPALDEVKFSIAAVRGCFGACSFCALTFHQGRIVTSRSKESVLAEAKLLSKMPDFKGYIHDVGGPTANFRKPACEKQLKVGACKNRQCLGPNPCPNVKADHKEFVDTLREMRSLPRIKKVFVRSGIRYDYMLLDKNSNVISEIAKYHVSGHLKVAPEHVARETLRLMGKPYVDCYERFGKKFAEASNKAGLEQYLTPYFISSHPGCTLEDAIELAVYMKKNRIRPEQVQDFYPTPGTLSTCMYYTGIDPRDGKKVYIPNTPREKEMQRALMQYFMPQNRVLVMKALHEAGRDDLIGFSDQCLVAPREVTGSRASNKNGYRGKQTRKASTEVIRKVGNAAAIQRRIERRKRTDPLVPEERNTRADKLKHRRGIPWYVH